MGSNYTSLLLRSILPKNRETSLLKFTSCCCLQQSNPITSDSNTIVQFLTINKMKKIHLILFTVFLNMALFSCTPTSVSDIQPSADGDQCCGNGGDIPPPPPNP